MVTANEAFIVEVALSLKQTPTEYTAYLSGQGGVCPFTLPNCLALQMAAVAKMRLLWDFQRQINGVIPGEPSFRIAQAEEAGFSLYLRCGPVIQLDDFDNTDPELVYYALSCNLPIDNSILPVTCCYISRAECLARLTAFLRS